MEEPSASFTSPLALLPTLHLDGAWQMAIDAWMLDQRRPMLRLYRWRRPTLSLGHHQRRLEPHWLELARQGVIDLVRRPSGGRAVLHGGDLTYALVWPDATGSREQVYRRACFWLQQAFAEFGLPLQFGRQAATAQPASCFGLSTAADLVHADGSKRIGSAQLWREGCLLQHGSIQVDPPQALWRELFESPAPQLPALPVAGEALEQALIASAARWLPMAAGGVVPVGLEAPALAAISRMAPLVQVDLASPEASIERTTGASARPRG
jgi:lipoate---protein ligase